MDGLTKRMKAILDSENLDTREIKTAEKMAAAGLITINLRRRILRGATPGMGVAGCKPGTWVYRFSINETHPVVADIGGSKRKKEGANE